MRESLPHLHLVVEEPFILTPSLLLSLVFRALESALVLLLCALYCISGELGANPVLGHCVIFSGRNLCSQEHSVIQTTPRGETRKCLMQGRRIRAMFFLLVCFFVYLLKMKIYLTLQLEDSDEEDEDSEEAWERPPSLYETQDLPIREGYLMMRGQ